MPSRNAVSIAALTVTSRSKESYFTKSYFLTTKFAIYLQKSGLSHEKQLFNHEIQLSSFKKFNSITKTRFFDTFSLTK